MNAPLSTTQAGRKPTPRRGRAIPYLLACALLLASLLGRAASAGQAVELTTNASPTVRLGLSMGLLRQFKENDAKAAMKVWVETLARERGISADPNVRIFDEYSATAEALHTESIDALSLPTDHYWALGSSNLVDQGLFPSRNGRITDEYLLLVHAKSGITNLAGLKGRSLKVWNHAQMTLAKPWLDTHLRQHQLPVVKRLFSVVTDIDKLTKVVIPVFFRETDACLVTRDGFDVMTELNPQVGTQLRTLAVSMPLVPLGFYFRKGYPAEPMAQLIDELSRLHVTPAGQQVLTVFQYERLMKFPLSYLASSIELLEEHRRLCGPGRVDATLSSSLDQAEFNGTGK